MRIHHALVATSLLLCLAAPAAAASKASLTAGGRTVAGPGALSLGLGAQERVFAQSGGTSSVCVTVINTGKSQLTLTITGATTPSTDLAAGATKALCGEDVQFVDLVCSGTANCSAQWRVDDN
jgi:hypothetical protein